jgi:hypothetical protein
MKRTVDILPCFIRLIVSKLLQNLISRGFADFFAQYLSILKEFWAVSHSQILYPCGFPNFSARNHSNFNINNDLNIFFSTFLRMSRYFLWLVKAIHALYLYDKPYCLSLVPSDIPTERYLP